MYPCVTSPIKRFTGKPAGGRLVDVLYRIRYNLGFQIKNLIQDISLGLRIQSKSENIF